jgi:hypothetical protein
MSVLVSLVKIGAIGASLAFLYLSYQLLKKELARAGKPRPEALAAITKQRTAALVFLIVGVLSELILGNGATIVTALVKRFLGDEFIQAKFLQWNFNPEVPSIEFALQRIEVNPSHAVSPARAADVDVYVLVREKGAEASNVGKYPLLYGPYELVNTGMIRPQTINKADASALGTHCAQFTAIGVIRMNHQQTHLTAPFDFSAQTTAPTVFDTAGACVTQPIK